jgi:uncharacterized protein (DUF2345 family)
MADSAGSGNFSVSTLDSSSSSGSTSTTSKSKKKQTQKTQTQKPGGDIRNGKASGSVDQFINTKTTSGHSFTMDDSKGAEHVTIQHRTGSSIQFNPDGSVHYTSHNGKYEMVFGEDRVTITGAHDITVKGDASLRVYGDYNVTAQKDYNLTVLGDFNVTAKNLNRSIRGNMDTEAKNVNKRVEGSATYNTQGAHVISSEDNMTVVSRTRSLSLGAGKHMNVKVDKGDMIQQINEGDMHHKLKKGEFSATYEKDGKKVTVRTENGGLHTVADGGDINQEVKQGKFQLKAKQQVGIKSESQSIQVAAPSGSIQHEAGQNYTATAQQSMDLRAPSGTATFAGQQTHVNADGGLLSLVGSGGGINMDSLGGLLNLNGGLGSIQSALGQLSFNFGDIQGAINLPQFPTGQAGQAQQEPDASGEINSWV